MADVWEYWDRVREAKTYNSVIRRATAWLYEIWPQAYDLGYAPKGEGNKGIWCPNVIISQWPPSPKSGVAGWYHHTRPGGGNIKVVGRAEMKVHADRFRWPVLDYLREVIGHEAQHAFDWNRGVDSGTHNAQFLYRLRKLAADFPETQL